MPDLVRAETCSGGEGHRADVAEEDEDDKEGDLRATGGDSTRQEFAEAILSPGEADVSSNGPRYTTQREHR